MWPSLTALAALSPPQSSACLLMGVLRPLAASSTPRYGHSNRQTHPQSQPGRRLQDCSLIDPHAIIVGRTPMLWLQIIDRLVCSMSCPFDIQKSCWCENPPEVCSQARAFLSAVICATLMTQRVRQAAAWCLAYPLGCEGSPRTCDIHLMKPHMHQRLTGTQNSVMRFVR